MSRSEFVTVFVRSECGLPPSLASPLLWERDSGASPLRCAKRNHLLNSIFRPLAVWPRWTGIGLQGWSANFGFLARAAAALDTDRDRLTNEQCKAVEGNFSESWVPTTTFDNLKPRAVSRRSIRNSQNTRSNCLLVESKKRETTKSVGWHTHLYQPGRCPSKVPASART